MAKQAGQKLKTFNLSKYLSTPFIVYAFLILITIALLICGYSVDNALSINVGYSLLASLIASILIDIGNTRVHYNNEVEQLNILSAEFKYDILGLKGAAIRAYEARYSSDSGRYIFAKWLEMAFDMDYKDDGLTDEDFDYIVWTIQFQITKIKKSSIELNERFLNHISISLITEEDRRLVRRIAAVSSIIEREFDEKKYHYAIKNIVQRLIPCAIIMYPYMEKEFNEEYSADEDM